MAFNGEKKIDWKRFFITNLTGIVCALGLAGLVSALCGYNFFLMLLIFIAMYFVIGIIVEYLMVFLYLEKAGGAVKKKKGEPTLPNRRAALRYAAACNMKVGNAADLLKKDGNAAVDEKPEENETAAEISSEEIPEFSEEELDIEIGGAEESKEE